MGGMCLRSATTFGVSMIYTVLEIFHFMILDLKVGAFTQVVFNQLKAVPMALAQKIHASVKRRELLPQVFGLGKWSVNIILRFNRS